MLVGSLIVFYIPATSCVRCRFGTACTTPMTIHAKPTVSPPATSRVVMIPRHRAFSHWYDRLCHMPRDAPHRSTYPRPPSWTPYPRSGPTTSGCTTCPHSRHTTPRTPCGRTRADDLGVLGPRAATAGMMTVSAGWDQAHGPDRGIRPGACIAMCRGMDGRCGGPVPSQTGPT